MSIDAIRWAFDQQGLTSSQKFVLVALADRAGPDSTAWPCYEQITYDTCLDRKTVAGAIRALVDVGLLRDTGERVGRTRQIPVYQLVGVPLRERGEQYRKRNSTENGTVPDFPRKSTENGTRNLPRNLPLTPPVYPPSLNVEAWTTWEAYRKQARKKLTPETIKRQWAVLTKLSTEQQAELIELTITNGWQGLHPDALTRSKPNGTCITTPHPDNSAAGRVRANVARARAERAAAAGNGGTLADDDVYVRSPLGF